MLFDRPASALRAVRRASSGRRTSTSSCCIALTAAGHAGDRPRSSSDGSGAAGSARRRSSWRWSSGSSNTSSRARPSSSCAATGPGRRRAWRGAAPSTPFSSRCRSSIANVFLAWIIGARELGTIVTDPPGARRRADGDPRSSASCSTWSSRAFASRPACSPVRTAGCMSALIDRADHHRDLRLGSAASRAAGSGPGPHRRRRATVSTATTASPSARPASTSATASSSSASTAPPASMPATTSCTRGSAAGTLHPPHIAPRHRDRRRGNDPANDGARRWRPGPRVQDGSHPEERVERTSRGLHRRVADACHQRRGAPRRAPRPRRFLSCGSRARSTRLLPAATSRTSTRYRP